MTPYELGRKAALEKVALSPAMMRGIEGRIAPALEVAGLGILAAPTVNDMVDPPWVQTEKRRHRGHLAELIGLGTLAAPSAYKLFQHIK